MGALSGVGNIDIWAVHGERLYIFASDQCRAGSSRTRPRCCSSPSPRNALSAEQAEAGKALTARLVKGLGGQAALNTVKSLSLRLNERVEHQDRHYASARPCGSTSRAV